MKISYSYPGMRLAIIPVHYLKVMKVLDASQIKNPADHKTMSERRELSLLILYRSCNNKFHCQEIEFSYVFPTYARFLKRRPFLKAYRALSVRIRKVLLKATGEAMTFSLRSLLEIMSSLSPDLTMVILPL